MSPPESDPIELLDRLNQAQKQQDWSPVGSLAAQILATDPDNEDAQDFQRIAQRRLAAAAPESKEEPLPKTLGDGRYRVRQRLGEGRRKLVYLATDATPERDVAVAVIKTDDLDPRPGDAGSPFAGPPGLPPQHRHRPRPWGRRISNPTW